MLIFRRKSRKLKCPISALFEVMDEDLNLGICCDIEFLYDRERHSVGAYGDDGETRKNVRYYLDKYEFSSRDELASICFSRFPGQVLVTECDGVYPFESLLLKKYLT